MTSRAPAAEPPAASEAVPQPFCPRCGARVERGQRICIACGRLLTPRYGRPPSSRTAFALLTALVALVGITAGFGIGALTRHHGHHRVSRAPAGRAALPTTTAPTTPLATPPATTPSAPATTAPPALTPPPAATSPPTAHAVPTVPRVVPPARAPTVTSPKR